MGNKSFGHYVWLLGTLTQSGKLSEEEINNRWQASALKDRILLDDVPGGTQFLATMAEAMEAGRTVEVAYMPLGHEEPLTFHVNPYCLREYRQRWYVLGWIGEREAMRQLAFDRMVSVGLTDQSFDYPKDFSPEDYYANDIGVTVAANSPVQTIRVRAYGRQVGLLRAMPLHKSQREVESGKGYADFEYHLRINTELKRELLAKANGIEVLEPQTLRDEMIREARSILKRYKK